MSTAVEAAPTTQVRTMPITEAGTVPAAIPFPAGHSKDLWSIDPSLTFLNHGSYGAVPKAAAKAQAALRERVERDPVRFYKSDLEGLLDEMRQKLGAFLNCRAADIAPCANATYALCHILYATPLKAGDEVLITDHEYSSLTNELERICAKTGAKVVKAAVPFPIQSPEQVAEAFLSCVTNRTRIAFISHITSGSSLVFPVAPIVKEFNARGIDIVVDGAHSPGHIPVDIAALKPTYFVTSGHKWLCGPKGTGFVYVRPDKQATFRPVCLSSRANKVRPERALFLRDFDYQGTDDYSCNLTVPHSIAAVGSMLPGGWPAVMRHNHELVMAGRKVVCDLLGMTPPAPESMIGSMATLLIPEPAAELLTRPTCYDDALQDELYNNHRIVVPIWRLNDNRRVVRISAHLYNTLDQYEKLGHALAEELAREQRWKATG
ncbi:MAG TPA: aminotransferase class V-fold PLP-dependent enzyme [Phycisphaerales bacterium]|nr:aminotransferase class V-fold PLP-dependent enzyme [Phycisphaerales bacterium]